MFLQLEDSPMISTNPFKNSIAVKQAVIEHRNLGALLVQILAVYIDLHARHSGVQTTALCRPTQKKRDCRSAGVLTRSKSPLREDCASSRAFLMQADCCGRGPPRSYNNGNCRQVGSRNPLTPNPSNRNGLHTSFSRPSRKQPMRYR